MPDDRLNLGLIGYPLEHSRSPQIHQAALQAAGLAGDYRLYPVRPGENADKRLADLVYQVRKKEIDGMNVTIPHKVTIMPWLDALTPEAEAIGAVNTLYRKGKQVVGANTDAEGFLADLRSNFPDLCADRGERTAIVLGAGGAARAVVFALARAGWKVWVAARRITQAQELVWDLNREEQSFRLTAIGMEALSTPLRDDMISLVVNATPAGMYPNIESTAWPPDASLPEHASVYDLVYNPSETALVQRAHGSGLPATGGMGMLIEQAALAFEMWTGLAAPRREMFEAMKKEENETW